MKKIHVFIKCQRGEAYNAAANIVETIDAVSEVDSISGEYDLLAKFYLADDEDVGHFVTERVQLVPGVRDTYTIMAFNAFL